MKKEIIEILNKKYIAEKEDYYEIIANQILELFEEETQKVLAEKIKEIERLNKIADRYAEAIALMADGVKYDDLPKRLQ